MTFPKHYAIFDLETTGLDMDTARIIEYAVLIRDEKGKRMISSLVKPDIPVPAEITTITGITQEMVDDEGVDPNWALGNLIGLVGTLPIIGHNILRYDIPLVHATAVRQGASDIFSSSSFAQENIRFVIDTAAFVKAKKMGIVPVVEDEPLDVFQAHVLNLKAYGIKYNLTASCEFLGIDTSDLKAHRAAADVEMVDRIYRKLCLGL